jgi:Tol biopolymer transport system component
MDTLVSDPGVNGTITTTSTQPVLTADGWFVAFLSNATNLVDDPVLSGFHIYLRNFLEGSLQLVDEDTNGIGSTDDQLALFSLSLYGRYIAFDSTDGSLVTGDNNHAYDVFTRDLFWKTTEMISERDATVIPQTGDNCSASQPSVSTNGQWVAFASVADDLTPNDTNNLSDVFVRDLLAGTTTLVSVATNGGPAFGGPSVSPVISADGRYVVFIGSASNLVVGQGVTPAANVFRRDLQTATTVLVSVSVNGVDAANGDCSSPGISQDGRYVVFLSSAGNLVSGVGSVGGGTFRTFLRDINLGTTTALTNVPPGTLSLPISIFPPSMSGDGHYVAYSSSVSPYQPQLRIWDDQLGTDIYANVTGSVSNAVLNANGTRVLYNASGTNFVDDVLTGTNVFTFNYPLMMWSPGGFSADGRYATFVAQTNIASSTNIYLCDLQTQTMTLVSSNFTPIVSGTVGYSDLPILSTDGRFMVYRSYAIGIVPGDTSPVPNIYRYDRLIGTSSDLTAGQVGLSPILWDSQPAINGDGGTVAFLSLGSGLVSEDLNRAPDAFAFAMDVGQPLDSDGDGIPDWWMIQYFGHPTGQAGDNSLAQDDADGTGMSNLDKFLAGLNPTNPASVFRITSINQQGTNMLISWQAGGGRTNVVQAAATVNGPYSNISPDISLPGVGDVFTNYLDSITNLSMRFYRIKLGP